jgi:hypothetical protein
MDDNYSEEFWFKNFDMFSYLALPGMMVAEVPNYLNEKDVSNNQVKKAFMTNSNTAFKKNSSGCKDRKNFLTHLRTNKDSFEPFLFFARQHKNRIQSIQVNITCLYKVLPLEVVKNISEGKL